MPKRNILTLDTDKVIHFTKYIKMKDDEDSLVDLTKCIKIRDDEDSWVDLTKCIEIRDEEDSWVDLAKCIEMKADYSNAYNSSLVSDSDSRMDVRNISMRENLYIDPKQYRNLKCKKPSLLSKCIGARVKTATEVYPERKKKLKKIFSLLVRRREIETRQKF